MQSLPRHPIRPSDVARVLDEACKRPEIELRDKVLLLLMYSHGLRLSEAADLQWTDVDLPKRSLRVKRLQHGEPKVHRLSRRETNWLRELRSSGSGRKRHWVFEDDDGEEPSPSILREALIELGQKTGLSAPLLPRSVRHATGVALAAQMIPPDRIRRFLGLRQLQSVSRYVKEPLTGDSLELLEAQVERV